MASYFFRVEHDLLRSESFKALGGSAIKVYLVIGLYSDFGSDWAYPSIRTIARQAGLSRQTVLAAITELTRAGLLATSKSKGRSTAYKIMRQPPPARSTSKKDKNEDSTPTVPSFLVDEPSTVPDFLEAPSNSGQNSLEELAQFLDPGGPGGGPKREPRTREETNSIPIP
ncbi:MAG TPA: helix-turn-helix domain-containing protein, partial [Isosphaeraceae bacterium]|nr:helix-turn-helix domain-containing protein [Isosphaeraceae bacterium]